jgi:hypothetical protein
MSHGPGWVTLKLALLDIAANTQKSDITVLLSRIPDTTTRNCAAVWNNSVRQSKSINSKNVEGPAFFDIYGHIFESVEAFFLEMELRITLTF